MNLSAENANSFDDLLSKWGPAGERVSDRAVRTTQEREAYLCRRLLAHLNRNGLLSYPITVVHSDAPDFEILEGSSAWRLEVTEATAERDQREMAKASEKPSLIGAFGGRGHHGYSGDEPEDEVIADINDAVRRKISKPYAASSCDLLLYVNSNPALCVHRETVLRRLQKELEPNPFRSVFLYWDSDTIDVLPRNSDA